MRRAVIDFFRQRHRDAQDYVREVGPEKIAQGLLGAATIWIAWDHPLYGIAFGVIGYIIITIGVMMTRRN